MVNFIHTNHTCIIVLISEVPSVESYVSSSMPTEEQIKNPPITEIPSSLLSNTNFDHVIKTDETLDLNCAGVNSPDKAESNSCPNGEAADQSSDITAVTCGKDESGLLNGPDSGCGQLADESNIKHEESGSAQSPSVNIDVAT